MVIAFVQSFTRIGGVITQLLGIFWPALIVAAMFVAVPHIGPAMVPGNGVFALTVTAVLLIVAAMFVLSFDKARAITDGINPYVMMMQATASVAAVLVDGLFVGSQYRDWYGQFELPPAGILGLAIAALGWFAYLVGMLYVDGLAERHTAAVPVADELDQSAQETEAKALMAIGYSQQRNLWIVYIITLVIQCGGLALVGFHLGATMIL